MSDLVGNLEDLFSGVAAQIINVVFDDNLYKKKDLDKISCVKCHYNDLISCVKRKIAYYLCKNKDADQLWRNCTTDQHLF